MQCGRAEPGFGDAGQGGETSARMAEIRSARFWHDDIKHGGSPPSVGITGASIMPLEDTIGSHGLSRRILNRQDPDESFSFSPLKFF